MVLILNQYSLDYVDWYNMKEVTLKGLQCEKCSHVWLPKKEPSKRRPKVCPKCKNHNWDSPRKLVSDKKKEQDLSFKDERRFR